MKRQFSGKRKLQSALVNAMLLVALVMNQGSVALANFPADGSSVVFYDYVIEYTFDDLGEYTSRVSPVYYDPSDYIETTTSVPESLTADITLSQGSRSGYDFYWYESLGEAASGKAHYEQLETIYFSTTGVTDVKLTPVWLPLTADITYDLNGGTDPTATGEDAGQLSSGTKNLQVIKEDGYVQLAYVIPATTPEFEGHQFLGWMLAGADADQPVDADKILETGNAEDIADNLPQPGNKLTQGLSLGESLDSWSLRLVAVWKEADSPSSGTDPSEDPSGDPAESAATITVDLGRAADYGCSAEVSVSVKAADGSLLLTGTPSLVNGDDSLWTNELAGWTINVSAYDDSGAAVGTAENPIQPGYEGTIVHYMTDAEQENLPVSITYTAVWKPFTVTFYDEDREKLGEVTGLCGDAIYSPADPTKEAELFTSYQFAGWKLVGDETGTLYGDGEGADGTKLANFPRIAGDAAYEAVYTSVDRTYDMQLTAKSGKVTYDGEEHSISGFDSMKITENGVDLLTKNFEGESTELTFTLTTGEEELTLSGISSSAKGTDAGKYTTESSVDGLKVTGADGTDYTEHFVPAVTEGTLEILAADTMAVSGTKYEGQYDGKAHGEPATVTIGGEPVEATLSYSTDGGGTWTTDYPTVTNVSDSCTVKVKAELANYETAEDTYTLTVTGAPVTVTANANSKKYGEDDPTLTATADGFLDPEDKSTVKYEIVREEGEDAGTYAIHVTGAARQGNYTLTFADGIFTIRRADAVIKVENRTKTYGEADPEFTGQVQGLVADGDLGTITYSRTNPDVEEIGTYEDVITASYTENKNYNVTVENGDFTIIEVGKLAIDVTDYNDEYDGKAHSVVAVPSVTDGTTVTYSTDGGKTWSEDVPTVTNVSDSTAVKVRAAHSGYETVEKDYNLTVNPKNVSIEVNPASKEFGAEDPAFTGQVTGLLAEEDLGTISYIRTNAGVEAVGDYADVLTASYTENDNYNVTVTKGDFSITAAKSLKVKTEGYQAVYDGKAHGAAAVATIGEEPAEAAISYSTDGGKTWVSNYPTVTNVSDSCTVNVKAELANYETAEDTYTLTVIGAPVTVTAQSPSKTYGENDPTLTATAEGFLDPDDESTVSYDTVREAGEDAGTYAIHVTGAAQQGNYALSYTDGVFTITPAEAKISAQSVTKTYGEADPEFTGQVQGLVADGDLGTITYSRTNPDVEDVGTYEDVITASYTENKNYNVTVENGDFEIIKAGTMTIQVADYTGEYDGKAHGTAAVPSVAEGTTVTYSLDGGETWQSEVPTVTNVTSGEGLVVQAKAENANYKEVTRSYTLQLNPRAVTITVDSKSKEYGAEDPVFTGSADRVLSSDDLGITYSRSGAGTDEAIGTYASAIAATCTKENANYSVTVVPGDFRITKSTALQVAGESYSAAYDGKSHGTAATATVRGEKTDAVISYSTDGGDTWSSDYPTATNVSDSKTVQVKAEKENYETVTANYTLAVTAAPLTVTADNASKKYGESDPALTATASGFVSQSDASTVTYTVARETGESAGTYPIHVTGDAQQGNYSLTFVDGTFTIESSKTAEWTYVVNEGSYTGETGGKAAQTKNTDTTFTVTIPTTAPVYEGHTFTGWYCSNNNNLYAPGASAELSYDDAAITKVTFTATYDLQPITVTVSFDAGGGLAPGAETQYFTMTDSENTSFVVTMPAQEPVKNQAFFDGWYCSLDNSLYQAGASIPLNYTAFASGSSANIVFTAKYTDAKTADVTYVLGVGSDYLQIVQLDRAATEFEVMINAEDPTYEDHYFEGWRNSVDGKLYPSGSYFIYSFDDVKNLEFVSEWTEIIDTGDYDLHAYTRYKFSDGSKQIGSDPTLYTGGAYFYLKSDSHVRIQ